MCLEARQGRLTRRDFKARIDIQKGLSSRDFRPFLGVRCAFSSGTSKRVEVGRQALPADCSLKDLEAELGRPIPQDRLFLRSQHDSEPRIS